MDVLSVRDYRNNLATYFDKAAEGERVLIRRKNVIYALVSVGNEDVSLSAEQQRQLAEMSDSVRKSWKQVKQMESGELPVKSALDFINEL
ncbi:MAG: hypothetical protein K2K55_05860 [Duncaniella sp.]|nr:hypothetical protein [Duncaniella sp.]